MKGFEEGYIYFERNSSSTVATTLSTQYIDSINEEIDKLVNDINSFDGFSSRIDTLKGDVAEFWHADTFNIKSALGGSKHRASVDRSHDMGSVDVSTNFGNDYGLKYYKTGAESAKQQAKSVFEKFKEYQQKGGRESIEEYLKKRGYSEDAILSDPIYSGQMRLIPTDQMKEAIKYLENKIAKESIIRPNEVKRYKETLDLLSDRIKDNNNNESIPLTDEDAKKLAMLAKKGDLDPTKLGLTTEELVSYKYVIQQAFKAGLSAATISMTLKIAPEIINAFKYLLDTGEVSPEQLRKIGVAALEGAGDGFLKGSVSAAITTICKSGILGEGLKDVNPSIVGAVTVLAIDTMKNAYFVANGKMTQRELANELVKEMFITTCSLIGGAISQSFIEIPVLGFMIGSLVGSILGSVTYEAAYRPVMSFCVSSGFTMFGLVEQNYELPEDVLKEIGVAVFEYEKFDYAKFEPVKFDYGKFSFEKFVPEKIDILFLRRGVIGISKIGFI